jgi:multidrug resistance efflux pump
MRHTRTRSFKFRIPHAGTLAVSGSLALFAAACGSYPAPSEKMTQAEATIRGAQEIGAASVPSAALSVKLAQEEVQRAKQLIQDGENKKAELTLLRAQADAELALAQAREQQAKNDASQALEQAKSLRNK